MCQIQAAGEGLFTYLLDFIQIQCNWDRRACIESFISNFFHTGRNRIFIVWQRHIIVERESAQLLSISCNKDSINILVCSIARCYRVMRACGRKGRFASYIIGKVHCRARCRNIHVGYFKASGKGTWSDFLNPIRNRGLTSSSTGIADKSLSVICH